MKVNFEELEKKYGSEFVNELKKDIELREEHGDEWKLEVIRKREYTDQLMLVTRIDAIIYDVTPYRLKEKRHIFYRECEKAIQLMNEMRGKK
jgi:hypothetical protein